VCLEESYQFVTPPRSIIIERRDESASGILEEWLEEVIEMCESVLVLVLE